MGRGHYILCLLTFCTKFGALGKKILCNVYSNIYNITCGILYIIH
nr:MAG TPA: hypothetical protein [Bacteriophage sp.]